MPLGSNGKTILARGKRNVGPVSVTRLTAGKAGKNVLLLITYCGPYVNVNVAVFRSCACSVLCSPYAGYRQATVHVVGLAVSATISSDAYPTEYIP